MVHAVRVGFHAATVGQESRIPMFHRIPARPWQIISYERVSTIVVSRRLAPHRNFLRNDALHHRNERVDLRLSAEVVNGESPRGCLAVVRAGPLAPRHWTHFSWRVHEPLHIRRSEDRRVSSWNQLSCDLPPRLRMNLEFDWRVFHSVSPHEGRRHVHARMRMIDTQIRTVDPVAPYSVLNSYGAI